MDEDRWTTILTIVFALIALLGLAYDYCIGDAKQ